MDKVDAVVADEPGLDPLSTQLEKFEKELLAHAMSTMNGRVAEALRTLTPYDFENSPIFPKTVERSKYLSIDPVTQGEVEDAGKKAIFEQIMQSQVKTYVQEMAKYETFMQNCYGITIGHLDEQVIALLSTDNEYLSIQKAGDPIRLIKLLRKMCRKERGVEYSIASFHAGVLDLFNCRQGNMSAVEYMQSIKLKYDILTSQFGEDLFPSSLKNSVLLMHKSERQWTGSTYNTCSAADQSIVNRHVKDRLLAYIGVHGFDQKLSGGTTLKRHISTNAATNKNPAVAYPSDIPDLLKLTTSIMPVHNPGMSTHKPRNNHSGNNQSQSSKSDNQKRDGAQFVQTQQSRTEEQHLLAEFREYDDSDLYGNVQFLQIGEPWFAQDGNTPESSEASRSHTANGSLERLIRQVSTQQLRPHSSVWDLRLLTKLHQVNIYTASDLRAMIPNLNSTLQNHGLSPLHATTIRALTLTHDNADLDTAVTTDLLHLVQRAARVLPTPQDTDWVHATSYKLALLGIKTPADLIAHAPSINSQLRANSLPTLRSQTLSYLLRHAHDDRGDVGATQLPITSPVELGEVTAQRMAEIGEVDTTNPAAPAASGEVNAPRVVETGEVTPLLSSTAHFSPTTSDNKTLSTITSHTDPTFQYSNNVLALHTRFKATGRTINLDWVLLDSGATLHLFTNGKLLKNIRKAKDNEHITVNTSGGPVTTCLQGDLPGIGPVWYQPDGIANVLSLALVSMHLRVTMDTAVDNSLIVHKTDGTIRRFGLSDTGLYRSDLADTTGSLLTITTVNNHKMKYSALDVRRADAARKLQATIGHPTTKQFIRIIETNLLEGCGTSRKDVTIAEHIYGPSRSALKGKTTTPTMGHVREEIEPIPDFVTDNYKQVTIGVDIMYVNRIPFVVSLSRHIYFTTAV